MAEREDPLVAFKFGLEIEGKVERLFHPGRRHWL
jgi:hypothetical protein